MTLESLIVDYKSAFDSQLINHVYAAMFKLGINFLKVEKELFWPFDTVQGFRQDDPLYRDLFNFAMASGLRKTGVYRNCRIFKKNVQLLVEHQAGRYFYL